MALSTGYDTMIHFVVGTFAAVQSGENFADGTFYSLQYHDPLCGWHLCSYAKP
ncbi:MAG: hypothetical protein LBV12_11735 [Puniceicoccales bacterium]|nr:hypothetical protein [Puniceicoccales bacterium]